MDVRSNTINNSVGSIVEMPREKVNSNKNETCSTGLHVCSMSYLKEFTGKRVVICKIHPKDVVSVPVDYSQAKMRVCRYEVIDEIKDNEAIADMAVVKKGSIKASEQESSDNKKSSKAKKISKGVVIPLEKKKKWDDYIETRNIPEDLTTLKGAPRQAFIKFCARLHSNGVSEKAGSDICGSKTLKELKTVIFGF